MITLTATVTKDINSIINQYQEGAITLCEFLARVNCDGIAHYEALRKVELLDELWICVTDAINMHGKVSDVIYQDTYLAQVARISAQLISLLS